MRCPDTTVDSVACYLCVINSSSGKNSNASSSFAPFFAIATIQCTCISFDYHRHYVLAIDSVFK